MQSPCTVPGVDNTCNYGVVRVYNCCDDLYLLRFSKMASEEVTLVETPVSEVPEVRRCPMGAPTMPYPSLSTNQLIPSLQHHADSLISVSFFRSWRAFVLGSEAIRRSI